MIKPGDFAAGNRGSGLEEKWRTRLEDELSFVVLYGMFFLCCYILCFSLIFFRILQDPELFCTPSLLMIFHSYLTLKK